MYALITTINVNTRITTVFNIKMSIVINYNYGFEYKTIIP
jgi:hypothetical protein